MLPAYRPKFVEAARTTSKAEQAAFTLRLFCSSGIATYFQAASEPSVLFGWKSVNEHVFDRVNHPAIRIFLFTRDKQLDYRLHATYVCALKAYRNPSVLRNRHVHRKKQPFVSNC
jgi:hypothetical protein